MKCEICGRGPALDGVTIYRQNPTGEAGVWRCEEHNEVHQEPEDMELIRLLEQNPQPPTEGEGN